MITLPIKKKWFDMILSGEKKEEYRNITPRYTKMFQNAANNEGNLWLILRNGYRSDSPSIKVFVHCSIGTGNLNWGAEQNTNYFVLQILKKESCRFDPISNRPVSY